MKYILLIKSWSNTELRKKCKIQEYGGYTGTDEGGTSGGTSGGTEQGGGTSQGYKKVDFDYCSRKPISSSKMLEGYSQEGRDIR